MLSLDNIFLVYKMRPTQDSLHPQLCGKMALIDNKIKVLEDNCGWLSELETIHDDEDVYKKIHDLKRNPIYRIVSLQDVHQGHAPDLLPELSTPPVTHSSVYEYVNSDGQPQTLEFTGETAFLDDFELSPLEVQYLLDSVRGGTASVFVKSEFEDFMKTEHDRVHQVLAAMKDAVKAGSISPDHLKAMTHFIYMDTMIPTMGNKRAWEDFLTRPRSGVFVSMDMLDFGIINKKWGYATGDQAIKAAGQAIRSAMDESTGRSKGKLFHVSGDEFCAFVPSPEQAAHFIRVLKDKLAEIPPINGTHQIAASVGVGADPESADQAQIQAKEAAKATGAERGQKVTHAYSSLPGYEGFLPLDQS